MRSRRPCGNISVEQAQDVSGTGAKVLNAIETIFVKQGADITAVGAWSKVEQAADDLFDADATSAEEQAVYVIQISAEKLDRDNGFDCVRVRCADVGTNPELGAALYVLYGLSYGSAPEALPSAIAD